ncbi:hypothetical protein ACR784_08085 [Sphingobacterium multivorum]|uniref:hypothetical protein n=1 Tax=Sphingobacterium TaxID=28453 RepID=UPI000E97CCC9|nr:MULTISPECIES: hypothetical protein [Sphingobacterium]HBI88506.1 hypothetical protein [Sphingobacterium sp.]
MKKIAKRIIGAMSIGVMTFGIVLGVNALTKKTELKIEKTEPELKEWHFDGATNPSNNDVSDATQYSEGKSSTCPGLAQTACNLNAPETSPSSGVIDLNYMVPGTSQTVQQRIQSAISSSTPNETVESFRAN